MSFSNEIKEHISKYKMEKFSTFENGLWKNNKQAYSHILPEENMFFNFLETYRNDLIDYISINKIKLHSDFHHLNSSQAMCLNFFFPLFHEHKLELLIEYLGFNNESVNYDSVCFEKCGIEAKFGRKPTSFDFYFETNSNKKIFLEIKYTEDDFGKAKINSEKFLNVYSKFLTPINTNFHNEKSFYNNFQILRNLVHINDNSFVVFVYPKNNKRIKKGVDKVTAEFLNPEFLNHFYAAEWETFIEDISKQTKGFKLKSQFAEFKKKYLP